MGKFMTQECVKKYDQHKAVDSPSMYSFYFLVATFGLLLLKIVKQIREELATQYLVQISIKNSYQLYTQATAFTILTHVGVINTCFHVYKCFTQITFLKFYNSI